MKDRKKPEKFWLPHGMPSDERECAFSSRVFPKASQIKALYKLWHYQFRTTMSYTRLTAKTAIEGLRPQGMEAAILPAPSTMAVSLHRLGFRLRHVVKSKPLKKVPQTEAIFANVQKKTGK